MTDPDLGCARAHRHRSPPPLLPSLPQRVRLQERRRAAAHHAQLQLARPPLALRVQGQVGALAKAVRPTADHRELGFGADRIARVHLQDALRRRVHLSAAEAHLRQLVLHAHLTRVLLESDL